jgi:hypothetical protein
MARKSQPAGEFRGVKCMIKLFCDYSDLEFSCLRIIPDDDSDDPYTSIAIKPGRRNGQYCIVYKNDYRCAKSQAWRLFSNFGEVSDVQIDFRNNVFIRYFEKIAAQRAVLLLRGSNFTPHLEPEPSNEWPEKYPDKISKIAEELRKMRLNQTATNMKESPKKKRVRFQDPVIEKRADRVKKLLKSKYETMIKQKEEEEKEKHVTTNVLPEPYCDSRSEEEWCEYIRLYIEEQDRKQQQQEQQEEQQQKKEEEEEKEKTVTHNVLPQPYYDSRREEEWWGEYLRQIVEAEEHQEQQEEERAEQQPFFYSLREEECDFERQLLEEHEEHQQQQEQQAEQQHVEQEDQQQDRQHHSRPPKSAPGRKSYDLVVAHFPFDTDRNDLQKVFHQFNPMETIIEENEIVEQLGEDFNWAVVKFHSRIAALSALLELNESTFNGSTLFIEFWE